VKARAVQWIVASAALTLFGCGQSEPQPPVDEPPRGEVAMSDPSMPHSGLTQTQGTDGVTIHFDQRGEGNITVVLVHGWSCDSGYWQRQRNWLAQSYRVVSVDLGGHGKSGVNRDDWSIGSFGGDVAAVADALELDSIILVGHSLGGPVVLAAAQLLGKRVLGVVGVDSLRGVAEPADPEQRARLRKVMEENFTDTVTGFVANMFLEDADPTIRDFVIRDMASAPPAVAIAASRGLGQFDAAGALSALTVPLVLINSDYRPTDVAPFEARVEDFRLVEMTGVGHFVMMEDAPTFNAHLDAAIKRFTET
jgi:pimeloyl-ACP methyl ester carboxylesterase